MSNKLVPLEDLPPEARVQVTPDHPAFKLYAAQVEQQAGLEPGTLTDPRSAVFKFKPGTDIIGMLPAIAAEAKQSGQQPTGAGAGRGTVNPPAVTPTDPRAAANAQLLDEAGPVGRYMIGLGKTLTDPYHGIRQRLNMESSADADERAARDQAIDNTTGGSFGELSGSAAQMALISRLLGRAATPTKPGFGIKNQYVNAGTTGGLYGLAQPTETGTSPLTVSGINALAGAGGQLAAQGIGTLVRPATAYASNAIKALADKAEQYGIPLRAADISPSLTLAGLQKVFDYLPFSGGTTQRAEASKGFNKALAKTMGEDSDDLLAALRNARTRNSATYDDLASRNTIQMAPGEAQDLIRARDLYARSDTSPKRSTTKGLTNYLNNLFDPTNGHGALDPKTGFFNITGAKYKELRSEAGQLAKKAAADNDGKLASFYGKVKETLDESMRRSPGVSAEDKAAYATADKQWGNMRTLENLAPKDASGDLDFGKLASVLMGKSAGNVYNRNAMIYGTGDQTLPEIARVGTTFLNRGTQPKWSQYTRKAGELAPKVIAPPALAGGLYALNAQDHEHGSGDPMTETLSELGALSVASALGGRALNSQWFRRGAPAYVNNAAALAERNLGARFLPAALFDEKLASTPGTPEGK
jgi:hypothetical protein